MLSEHENKLLSETGAGTPMGELFRRFWIPVLLSEELPGPDCDPVAVRILGEDLVAFRDSDGQVGLVSAYCAHRHASLFWGRNEECGLRCTYHGWKYDRNGDCVDMPNEPPESRFKEKINITAYPTRDCGGAVWAYMGPKELEPARVPQVEWVKVPESHVVSTKRLQECNWAQACEGGLDVSHVAYLHTRLEPDRTSVVQTYTRKLFAETTEYGMLLGIRGDAADDQYSWSMIPYLLPSGKIVPRGGRGDETMGCHWWIPIDDHHCWDFATSWNAKRPIHEEEKATLHSGAESPSNIHAEVDRESSRWDLHLSNSYQTKYNLGNNYGIDRQAQRMRSFTGIKGFSEQDFAIQESMGRIAPRWLEHLGTTDVPLIEYRKLILGLIRDLLEGKEPEAPHKPDAYHVRVASVQLSRDIEPEAALTGGYTDP